MPRPKSDIKPVQIKLGDEDQVSLDDLAADFNPPNRSEAIRLLIRAEIERRRKRAKKISV